MLVQEQRNSPVPPIEVREFEEADWDPLGFEAYNRLTADHGLSASTSPYPGADGIFTAGEFPSLETSVGRWRVKEARRFLPKTSTKKARRAEARRQQLQQQQQAAGAAKPPFSGAQVAEPEGSQALGWSWPFSAGATLVGTLLTGLTLLGLRRTGILPRRAA